MPSPSCSLSHRGVPRLRWRAPTSCTDPGTHKCGELVDGLPTSTLGVLRLRPAGPSHPAVAALVKGNLQWAHDYFHQREAGQWPQRKSFLINSQSLLISMRSVVLDKYYFNFIVQMSNYSILLCLLPFRKWLKKKKNLGLQPDAALKAESWAMSPERGRATWIWTIRQL